MTRPLDRETPAGQRAEDQINNVLAGVITRLQSEGKPVPAAPAKPTRKRGAA